MASISPSHSAMDMQQAKTDYDTSTMMPLPSSDAAMMASSHAPITSDPTTNPQLWSLPKKLYTSSVSFLFTFVFLFGASSFSQGIPLVEAEFFPSRAHSRNPRLSMNPIQAIVAFNLYIFGIVFAPVVTPHLTERFGRRPIYVLSTFISALFVVGTTKSHSFAALAVTRFFAGFFGGPVAVLVEGTFADLWPAAFTGSYYVFIMLSQYLGAASGAIAGGALIAATGNWRWPAYMHLILQAGALAYAVGFPETFTRSLIRRHAIKNNRGHNLEPAPTGTDLNTMVRLTVVEPLVMLLSEPLIIMMSLLMSLNFGVLFQAFVSVPAVLSGAGLGPRAIGLAFFTAFGGALLAGVIAFGMDQALARRARKRRNMDNIEFRMAPAMLGAVLMAGALFWIGWTTAAGTSFPPQTPLAGVGVYVCGSALTLIGFISYLFDAYPPQATLSGLTTVACTRVFSAGWFMMYVPIAVLNIPSQWLFGIWGFIAIAFVPFPFVIFFWGRDLREKSRYGGSGAMSYVAMEMHSRGGGHGAGAA